MSKIRTHTGLFITGTDTACGKTTVTLAIIRSLQDQGLQVVGMKPVASGGELINGICCNEDALRIQQVGSVHISYELINPYVFSPPIAPHIAAAEVLQDINHNKIRISYEKLTQLADIVIVEGVGGWSVPLGRNFAVSDLPKLLKIPVLLVVGLRLGCINHALLTANSIIASGEVLAGWIANQQDPHMLRQQAVITSIAERIKAPFLGYVPYISPHDSITMFTRALDLPGIANIFISYPKVS